MSLSRRVINELRRDWTELWQCKNNIFHVKQENNATMFQIFFEGNYESYREFMKNEKGESWKPSKIKYKPINS